MMKDSIETIVITGATGFAGGRIAEFLSKEYPQKRIITTGRNIQRKAFLENLGCEFHIGDLSNSDFVKSIVPPRSAIIHCAALSSPWGSKEEFMQANIITTRNLIETAKRNQANRFIYISTPSIYFDFNNRINILESDPLPKTLVNDYAKTKLMAEEMVKESGLINISLRPRALIGRGDTVIMPRVLEAYKQGTLKIVGNGKNVVDLTGISNLVHAVHLSLFAEEKASGHAFNISAGDPVLMWDVLKYMMDKLGNQIPSKSVPYWVAISAAQAMEWYSKYISKKEPVLTKYSVGILAKSMTLNIDKAKELLGFVPIQKTIESVDEFVEWHLKEKARDY
jgi:2-alkyl-3-oxoalkanoate reductase